MAQWQVVLEEVIRERRGALVGYACLYAPDRATAEDLVQEALVRVFSRPRTISQAQAAEGYVRQAIRTTFLDQARKDKVWRGKQHLFHDDEGARSPEHAAAAGVDVRGALATFTPRERACVVLRHYDDLSVPDIAAELGVSDGAVKRYLSDAATKLRARLDVDVTEVEAAPVRPLTERSAR